MNAQCEICEVLKTEPDNFLSTKYWRVNLAPDQGYLGRSYVTLRKHKAALADLSSEEWSDFAELSVRLEHTLTKTFSPALFNWTCLTNNAFQEKPYNPHLHWHFRPRYEASVRFAGHLFTDADFGYHYDRDHKDFIDKDILNKIAAEVISNL